MVMRAREGGGKKGFANKNNPQNKKKSFALNIIVGIIECVAQVICLAITKP